MIKRIFRFFAVILTASVMFSACQKEQIESEEDGYGKRINAEQVFDVSKALGSENPIEKGFTVTKPGYVYVLQGTTDPNGEIIFKQHRTLKIRNLNWTIAQEWLLDDLQTDGFEDFSFYPGDNVSNAPHGFYYSWNQIESAADANDWQYMIYRDASGSTPIIGEQFHLPKLNSTLIYGQNDGDIEKLASMLGSTSLIRQKLQMVCDGVYVSPSISGFDNRYAYMWIEVRATPWASDPQSGCGCLGSWDSQNNNNFSLVFSNNILKANVRLVRNITQSQW